ncbi:hypothetical protein DNK56_03900 [Streptomyces sp. AC1-42W]|nr:hypothetical protein DNK55_27665 [Streptomyces sp. AC1-42T]PZT81347.1 hypothetical protein DNK56_03900 [Streptomyces sp. AC1-42W]
MAAAPAFPASPPPEDAAASPPPPPPEDPAASPPPPPPEDPARALTPKMAATMSRAIAMSVFQRFCLAKLKILVGALILPKLGPVMTAPPA